MDRAEFDMAYARSLEDIDLLLRIWADLVGESTHDKGCHFDLTRNKTKVRETVRGSVPEGF